MARPNIPKGAIGAGNARAACMSYMGLTIPEIAEKENISCKAVEVRIIKARKDLNLEDATKLGVQRLYVYINKALDRINEALSIKITKKTNPAVMAAVLKEADRILDRTFGHWEKLQLAQIKIDNNDVPPISEEKEQLLFEGRMVRLLERRQQLTEAEVIPNNGESNGNSTVDDVVINGDSGSVGVDIRKTGGSVQEGHIEDNSP